MPNTNYYDNKFGANTDNTQPNLLLEAKIEILTLLEGAEIIANENNLDDISKEIKITIEEIKNGIS